MEGRMDKEELIRKLRDSRDALQAQLHGLSKEAYSEPGVVDGWTLKDVLAHLNRWEGEMVTMLWELKNGKTPSRQRIQGMDDVDRMNAEWHGEDRDRPLGLVRSDFRSLRTQTIRRLQAFSEQELNDSDAFDGLRDEPLWRWVAVDTYEHEQEHLGQIKRWRSERSAG
jgi:uncharacterized protein (TIGR03083 family)